MTRLPTVGADEDTWGTVLNAHLTGPDVGVRYVSPANGADSNGGYTWALAKATIASAYASLPSGGGGFKGGGTIILAPEAHDIGSGLIFQKDKPVILTGERAHRAPNYAVTRTMQENPVLYLSSAATQLVEIKQPTGTVMNGYGFQFFGLSFDMTSGSPDFAIYAENISMAVVEDCAFWAPEPQTKAQWGIRCKKVAAHGDDSSWWRIVNNNTNRCGLVYAGDGSVGNNTNQFLVAYNVVFPGSQVDSCIRLEGGHRIVTLANNCEPATNPAYGLRFEYCSAAQAIGDSGEQTNGTFLYARNCNGCRWEPTGASSSTADTDILIDDDSSSNVVVAGSLTGQGSLYDTPEYSHLTRTGFGQAPIIGANGISWPGLVQAPVRFSNSLPYLHPEPQDLYPGATLTYEYWDGAAWAAWSPTDGNNPRYPNSDYLVVDDTHKRFRVKLASVGNSDTGVLMARAFGAGSYSGTFTLTVEDLSGADAVQATHGPWTFTMTSGTEGFAVPLGFITGPRLRAEVNFSFLTAGQSMRVSRINWWSVNNTKNVSQGGRIMRGSGTPEANVTGRVGDLFLRLDGGAATTLYVKESGAGNTGWVGK